MQRLVVELDLPAGVLEPAFGHFGRCGVEVLVEERGPIVWRHLVERGHDIVECIGLELGAVVGAAVEEVAEVVNGFLAVGDVVNDGGDFKPHQVAFVVVVLGAAPVGPAAAAIAEAGHGDGGVEQADARCGRDGLGRAMAAALARYS